MLFSQISSSPIMRNPRRQLLTSSALALLASSAVLPAQTSQPNAAEVISESRADIWFKEADQAYEAGKAHQKEGGYRQAARAFSAAVPLFERFYNNFPNHEMASTAMYRCGVSNILIGRRKEAEANFLNTLSKTRKKGQIAAAAAFRLGALAYNDKFYKTALPHFTIAANQTDKADLRHKSINYQARCLLQTQQIKKASPVLQRLVDDPDRPNAFRDQARLALAHIEATSGGLAKAFDLYKELAIIEAGSDPSLLNIQAQAIVHGGMTAMQLEGKKEEGMSMLNKALRTVGLPNDSKAEAQLTLIQHQFSNKAHRKVQELFRLGPFSGARAETTGKILLLTGRSCAALGEHNSAVEMFIGANKAQPNTKLAFEANYRTLRSCYESAAVNVPERANTFIEAYKHGKYAKDPWIQEARLMKAETYFAFEDWESATKTWERVNFDRLPDDLKGPAFFKSGWALVENDEYNGAIKLLSEFISDYPGSENYYPAIAKRAQCYLESGDRLSSLRDCERILENETGASSLTAFALQLSGRIFRQEGKNKESIAAYQRLLKEHRGLTQDTIARANYDMGLAHFALNDFETALIHLNKARATVPEFYEDPAGSNIALCHYRLKNPEELRKAVARLFSINPQKQLPRRLLVWLGLQMYEKSEFEAADHYLTRILIAKSVEETELGILKALAKSRLSITGREGTALPLIDNIIAREDDTFWRSDALLDQANAHLAVQNWNQAEISALRGLDLDPQGSVKAGLNLALGDVFLARGDYNSASSSYVRASEFYLDDGSTKPLALYKAAWTLAKAGKRDAAEAFHERLSLSHPNWNAPKRFNVVPGSAKKSRPPLVIGTSDTPASTPTQSTQPQPVPQELPPGIIRLD